MTDPDRQKVADLASSLSSLFAAYTKLEEDRDRWRQLAHDRSAALLDALKKLDGRR